MLQMISRNIIDRFILNNVIGENEDRDIYAYGMELIISSVINILSVFIVSIFFGRFSETAAFFLAFIPIRTYAGGYHARTHLRCFSLLMAVYTIVLLVLFFMPEKVIYVFSVSFAVISIILVANFAPIEDDNKKLTLNEKTKYRKVSIAIVIVQFILLTIFLFILKQQSFSLGFSLGQISATASLAAVRLIKY